MAERRDEVDRRPGGGVASRVAPLVGVVIGIGVLAGLAFGFTRALRDEPPPPPPPPAAAPAKPTLRIVFPEGFTRKDMARRIREVNAIARRKRKIRPKLSPQAYLRWTSSRPLPDGFKGTKAPNLEGFLFPATYEFTADTTSRALVRKQLDAFERAWKGVDLRYARSRRLTPYDVLVIASMVEEEVRVARERPLVAAVIYNRLRAGIPLGIDATIRYGLGVPPTQALRESQLADPNPYNTRVHTGLPPTPISNPGLAAIQAAAHPAKVDYLFFVRKEDCKSHFFTADEAEFYARLSGPRC